MLLMVNFVLILQFVLLAHHNYNPCCCYFLNHQSEVILVLIRYHLYLLLDGPLASVVFVLFHLLGMNYLV